MDSVGKSIFDSGQVGVSGHKHSGVWLTAKPAKKGAEPTTPEKVSNSWLSKVKNKVVSTVTSTKHPHHMTDFTKSGTPIYPTLKNTSLIGHTLETKQPISEYPPLTESQIADVHSHFQHYLGSEFTCNLIDGKISIDIRNIEMTAPEAEKMVRENLKSKIPNINFDQDTALSVAWSPLDNKTDIKVRFKELPLRAFYHNYVK